MGYARLLVFALASCLMTSMVNVGGKAIAEPTETKTNFAVKPRAAIGAGTKEFEFDDYDFWAEQCRFLREENDYEKTLSTCEKAIAIKPGRDNTDLWEARSYALFKQRNYLDAIASYDRVLEVAPTSSIAMAYQCASLFQLNRYDDAIDTCEEALQVNGIWGFESPAIAWYYRGLSLQATRRLETALESFIRAITIEPTNVIAMAGLCSLESDLHIFPNEIFQRDIIRRLDNLQDKTEESFPAPIGPRSRNPQYVICPLQTASELYEQALNAEPKNATLWMEQGLILEQLGEYEQAFTSYEKASDLLPDYAIALAHKCAMLVQLQRYEPALEACELALAGNNNWGRQGEYLGSAYGWTQKSGALIGLGKYEEAIAAAERAIAIAPTYSPAWNNKAISYWHQNKLPEGLKTIKKALAKYKDAVILAQYHDDATIQGEAFEIEYDEAPIFFYRSQILALFNQGRILATDASLQTEDIALQERSREAIAAYKKALDIEEQQAKSWGFSIIDNQLAASIRLNLAYTYIVQNRIEGCVPSFSPQSGLSQAVKYAEQALDYIPKSFAVLYPLGLAQLHSCDFLQAETTFAEALKKEPEHTHAMTALGIALAQNKKRQEAIETFEQVLNLNPSYSLAEDCRNLLIFGTVNSQGESIVEENICRFWLI